MLLFNIYKRLNSTGIARNHAIFSSHFLGRSPRYYDYLICSGSQPSVAVLATLAIRLEDLADKFRSEPRWACHADMLRDMAVEVRDEIKFRSYTDAWHPGQRASAALTQGRARSAGQLG
jgi:hypothetical protein